MFCKRLAELQRSALPLAMATLMVAGTYVRALVVDRCCGDVSQSDLVVEHFVKRRLARGRQDL